MEYKKIHAIFFSATGTTRKIIDTIARGCDVNEIERHDLLLKKQNDTYIPENEIAIFGMPVYAGRIPAISAESLRHFTGKHTPAIIACTYGNRAYDDALLGITQYSRRARIHRRLGRCIHRSALHFPPRGNRTPRYPRYSRSDRVRPKKHIYFIGLWMERRKTAFTSGKQSLSGSRKHSAET